MVQLEELLAVRHSVFIVGNAGTGKTQIWKTLYETYKNQDRRPIINDLNPKSVTNDELFGIINPATREWKDGLFSSLMREQAKAQSEHPKWIILDGDIDPMWIESLNTVMDDNKVLTLASNERIALTKEMRLIFEVGHLQSATPATVSRGMKKILFPYYVRCFCTYKFTHYQYYLSTIATDHCVYCSVNLYKIYSHHLVLYWPCKVLHAIDAKYRWFAHCLIYIQCKIRNIFN